MLPADQKPSSVSILADPLLSASLYCAGRLDEVIGGLVAPVWRALRREGLGDESYLWMLRYARGGEHLKLRLHGPESAATCFRERLDLEQRDFFANLEPAPSSTTQGLVTRSAPAIDVEDAGPEVHPDRALRWTTYLRSPLSLGPQHLLDDERYLHGVTRCLGRATEIVLRHLGSAPGGRQPFKARRNLLLRALVAGLSRLPFSPDERALYVLYHRDTLLRFLRRRQTLSLEVNLVEDGPAAMTRTVGRFDTEVRRLRTEEDPWAGWHRGEAARDPSPWDRDLREWSLDLAGFWRYAELRCSGTQSALDPFAIHLAFPLLFKAIHGLANQAGVNHLNEAFLHHLLASSTLNGSDSLPPVQLVPEL